MIKNKFKRGFTLIELMTVISIVAILIVLIFPGVNGYMDRAYKINVITQSRNVVQYCVSSNVDVESSIKLSKLVDDGMLSDYEGKLDYLQDDIYINTLLSISSDQDALSKIKLKDRKIVEWIGENSYRKSEE